MKNWKYIEGAKTGNAGITDKEFNSENEMRRWCIEHNYTYTPVGGGYYRLEDDSGKNRKDLEAHVKAGNKTGNEDKTGAEEFFKQLSDDVKEREKKDDADIEKVGNLSKDELLKELDAEEKLLKVLKERGGEKGYGTNPILYRDAERRIQDLKNKLKQIGNKVGNSKTGNSAYDDGAKKGKEDKRKGKLITAAGFEYHAPGYSYLSFKEKEEYRKGYYSTNDLKKEDIYKWGNSASDDKFAYVMREFDEGKLKTPDGKVVTDPAQAKAIAYSESKKTENGLARARRAMAGNGLLDTVLSKTKHIKRFGIGSKVQAEGETGTVVKETVEVGPNGIPFGWVTVKFSDGKTRQYYDYDLKK